MKVLKLGLIGCGGMMYAHATNVNKVEGIEIVSVALAKVTPDEDSRKRIEEFDTNVMHAAPDAMAGGMAYAQMRAMRDAANNAGGAMTGFMGVGMAAGAMGVRGQETLLSTAAELESKRSETAAVKCTACGAAVSGKFFIAAV